MLDVMKSNPFINLRSSPGSSTSEQTKKETTYLRLTKKSFQRASRGNYLFAICKNEDGMERTSSFHLAWHNCRLQLEMTELSVISSNIREFLEDFTFLEESTAQKIYGNYLFLAMHFIADIVIVSLLYC